MQIQKSKKLHSFQLVRRNPGLLGHLARNYLKGRLRSSSRPSWKPRIRPSGYEKPLSVAVLGVGHMGRYHLQKYFQSPFAKVVAVVDSSPERARKIIGKRQIAIFGDSRELLNYPVQCVSIATPTSSHFEIAAELLAHGIDVLVEKPLCVNSEQARQLLAIAAEKERILQVGHLERFNPAFVKVREQLDDPRFFEVRRISPFPGRGEDVDVILDLMIHDIDLILSIIKRPVIDIQALGVPVLTDETDIASVRLKFEGGAIANLTASRVAAKTERSLRIFQKDIYVSLDCARRSFRVCRLNYDRCHDRQRFLSIDNYEADQADPLCDQIDSFLFCVATRSQPEVTALDGFKALELAEKIKSQIICQNEAEAGQQRNYYG